MKILLAFFGIICVMMGIIVAPSSTVTSDTRLIAIFFLFFGIWLIWLARKTNKKISITEYSELKTQYEQLQTQYSELQEENKTLLSKINEVDSLNDLKSTLLSLKIEIRELSQEAVCSQYGIL